MNLSPIVYHIGWALWLGWFVIFETIALRDTDLGDTFSEHVWWAIFEPSGRPRPVIYYLALGFMIWLTVHFLFKGRLG